MLVNVFSHHRLNSSYQGKIRPYEIWSRESKKKFPFNNFRFYSSLRKKCAMAVNKKLIDWIKSQRAGPFSLDANQPTSNVFIADFIELNNFEFCRTVVGLNDRIVLPISECNSSDKIDENIDKNIESECGNNEW